MIIEICSVTSSVGQTSSHRLCMTWSGLMKAVRKVGECIKVCRASSALILHLDPGYTPIKSAAHMMPRTTVFCEVRTRS